MANALTLDRVLLVSELKMDEGHSSDDVRVIQRRSGGVATMVAEGEVDVAETEGLGARVGGASGVLCGAEEPEETGNAEVGNVAIELAMLGVLEVQDGGELLKDDGVDRVDPLGGLVLVFEGGQVSRE